MNIINQYSVTFAISVLAMLGDVRWGPTPFSDAFLPCVTHAFRLTNFLIEANVSETLLVSVYAVPVTPSGLG